MAEQADTTEWPASRVRDTFLAYFEERGHTVMASSSVVPHDDDTLLFVNSGMVRYKKKFLGTVTQSDPMYPLRRAANIQNCIRAGGKHNDLDDVGKDSYHHTCFLMAGNWSFGDYFKKEAIEYAWDLLTRVYGLDRSRLYATYFEGDARLGLDPDTEARDLWKTVGVPEDHILPGSIQDNFWEMGDQGPCGPCSELHYDIRGGRNAADLVNKDDPEVIEIWNLVFMAYNREPDRSLKPLPAKHIDTGMGFERLVSCLQGKRSNYGTDIFSPLFARIQEVTGARPYGDAYGADDSDGVDTAYRVVADHVRLLSLAIVDGAVPNNAGRGYVVRRVLRRGVRYARKYLKVEIGSFFSKISPALNQLFPVLESKQDTIKEILDEEEAAFAKTLDRGETQFERYAAAAAKSGQQKLAGSDVWRLYDTFGFPEDLTEIMAAERGLVIDKDEVRVAQEAAREASKGAKAAVQTFSKLSVHQLAELERLEVARTRDDDKFVRGNSSGTIQLIWTGQQFVRSTQDMTGAAGENRPLGLILDATNFYAESGGQVADTGNIVIDGVAEFKVLDVQSYGGYIVHSGYLMYGALAAGNQVVCEYDELRRSPIRKNHTGTHILNHSLREVLGEDVHQRGSLVDDQKLRFDLSHKAAITTSELEKIEALSNAYIRRDVKVYARDVVLAEGHEIHGLRAVFGETYPDPVRVVAVGVDIDSLLADPHNPKWRGTSVEFCGGTHVESTGVIKDLSIVEEGGIAKGIRRIVAFTGEAAQKTRRDADALSARLRELTELPYGPEKEREVKEVQIALDQATISTVTKTELRKTFDAVLRGVIEEQKKAKKAQKSEGKSALEAIDKHLEDHPADAFWVGRLPISANSKAITEALRHCQTKAKERSVCVFGADASEGGGPVAYGVYVGTEHVAKGVTAEAWMEVVNGLVDGKGGGKGPIRQGSGNRGDKIDDAVEEARRWLEEKMKI